MKKCPLIVLLLCLISFLGIMPPEAACEDYDLRYLRINPGYCVILDLHGNVTRPEGSIELSSDFKNGIVRTEMQYISAEGEWISQECYFNSQGKRIDVDPEEVIYNSEGYLCSDKIAVDQTGKEVIRLSKYVFLGGFSEGLAAVRDTDTKKIGFVNTRGDIVIPPDYSRCFEVKDYSFSGFFNGNAQVILNGESVLIDKKGKVILTTEKPYVLCGNLISNRALAYKKEGGEIRYGYVSSDGELAIPCRFKTAFRFSEKGYAVADNNIIDVNGTIVYKAKAGEEVISPFGFGSDNALVRKNGKYLFVRKSGEPLFPFPLKFARPYYQGVATTLFMQVMGRGSIFSPIDENGESLFPPVFNKGYSDADEIDNPLFLGTFSDGYVLTTFAMVPLSIYKLDRITKETVSKAIADLPEEVSRFPVSFPDKIVMMDYSGKIHSQIPVGRIGRIEGSNYFSGHLNNAEGTCVIDNNGDVISKPRQGEILSLFRDVVLWRFPKDLGEDQGIERLGENKVVRLPRLTFGSILGDIFPLVPVDGLFEYFNLQGEKVFSIEADEANPVRNGVGAICRDEKWYLIDEKGNQILDTFFEDVGFCSQGLIPARQNGKWGYIDKEGRVVVDFKYTSASEFKHGLAIVGGEHGMNGVIDRRGNIVVEMGWNRFYLH